MSFGRRHHYSFNSKRNYQSRWIKTGKVKSLDEQWSPTISMRNLKYKEKMDEFREILIKHEIDPDKYDYILNQILCILQEHECGILVKNMVNGKSVTIHDSHKIEHAFQVQSTGKKFFLNLDFLEQGFNEHFHGYRDINIQDGIWSEKESHIYMSGEIHDNKNPFGGYGMSRHMVQAPMQKYADEHQYGLHVSKDIWCLIWQFACDVLSGDQGLYYLNFESKLLHNKSKTLDLYDDYVRKSVSGKIGFYVKINDEHCSWKLFCQYYGKIIARFNTNITTFIEKNKFYQITPRFNKLLTKDELQIKYSLQYNQMLFKKYAKYKTRCDDKFQANSYKFVASLSGFNNMNLNQAFGNNTYCKIESDVFFIKWWCERTNFKDVHQNIPGTLAPPSKKWFELPCDELTYDKSSKDKPKLIDAEKFYDFLLGSSKTPELMRIREAHANTSLTGVSTTDIAEGNILISWEITSSKERQEDKLIV